MNDLKFRIGFKVLIALVIYVIAISSPYWTSAFANGGCTNLLVLVFIVGMIWILWPGE